MDVFNAYLEGAERELAIEAAREDVEFSRYMTMLEMVDLHHAQLVREAEFKVFSEGGTYDDYMYLLEEANKETAAKKDGIFTSIFNAIGQLIQGIANAISSIFTGDKSNVDPNANIQLTPEDQSSIGVLDTVKNAIPNFVNDITAGNYKKAIQDAAPFAALAVGGSVIAGAVVQTVKGSKVTEDGEKAKGVMQMLQNALNSLKQKITGLPEGSEEKNDATKCASLLQKACQLVNGATKTLAEKVTDIKDGVAEALKGNVVNAPTQPQQNQPTPEQVAKRVPMADRVKAGGTMNAATRQAAGIESADDTISIEQSIFGELFAENSDDDEFDVDDELAKLCAEIM